MSSNGSRGSGGGRKNKQGRNSRARRGPRRSGSSNSNGSANMTGASAVDLATAGLTDEQVLIEFMSYLRNDHPTAVEIHRNNGDNSQQMIVAARQFLRQQSNGSGGSNNNDSEVNSKTVTAATPASPGPAPPPVVGLSLEKLNITEQDPAIVAAYHHTPPRTPTPIGPERQQPPPGMSSSPLRGPSSLLPPATTSTSFFFNQQQQQQHNPSGSSLASGPLGSNSSLGSNGGASTPLGLPPGAFPQHHQQQQLHPSSLSPVPPGISHQAHNGNAILPSLQQPPQQHSPTAPPSTMPTPPHAAMNPFSSTSSPPRMMLPGAAATSRATPHRRTYSPPSLMMKPAPPILPSTPPGDASPARATSSSSSPQQPHPPNNSNSSNNNRRSGSSSTWQPKRIWCQRSEQPGLMFANDIPSHVENVNLLRPRSELTAKWVLPLAYLRQRTQQVYPDRASKMTLTDALEGLTVGLFRRGTTENGSTASIISKQVLKEGLSSSPSSGNAPKFVLQNETVIGWVPFYAPRTPGHVLFRLYWEKDSVPTLATGPTLFIKVSTQDFESTLRFILSNFKSKKSNATSLSSLNALALVLEQFDPSQHHITSQNQRWESAGRAAWGCVCESRKVLDACATEYLKQKEKIARLETELKELSNKLEEQQQQQRNGSSEDDNNHSKGHELESLFKEKTGAFRSSSASNERKWRDSQSAFASILRAILSNRYAHLLFRRELLSKLRLELELYCPLVEAFAPSPFNRNETFLCVNFSALPQHVHDSHYQQSIASRHKMQQRELGFVPNRKTLEQVVMKQSPSSNSRATPAMDRTAVENLNQLSAAMGQLYQEKYMVSDRVLQQREMVRAHVESIVAQSGLFPPGTRVVIFGSSANGFGSPSSDLDMCLQLPANVAFQTEEDPTGSVAMGNLADVFEKVGLHSVDTARLTARIPIIMFQCPRPGQEGGDGRNGDAMRQESNTNAMLMMDCDLSMQNPLAVLNTSLLYAYSRVHPVARVLASIIKRWAKARNMNNPSQHTLSSYGYILMLLHFLTYHRRTGTGLVTSVQESKKDDPKQKQSKKGQQHVLSQPLLPNLQWMDPAWVKQNQHQRMAYTELEKLPQQMAAHPWEKGVAVNTYFCKLNEDGMGALQQLCPSQDLSLAILLASFFRYYAYEFDYKKHVVSLHSTIRHEKVEREIKAEYHQWKVYGTGLAIEDPFETFYDVAHVLKGYNFHKLRDEFALAYTKIINSATQASDRKVGMELVDWICEPVQQQQQSTTKTTTAEPTTNGSAS